MGMYVMYVRTENGSTLQKTIFRHRPGTFSCVPYRASRVIRPPPILAVRDRFSFCWSGVFAKWDSHPDPKRVSVTIYWSPA